ncbi:hypothetical protein Naga_100377g5 [Nannochloropsis gaditana]|uniref:Uncharacterized protein n=1 Tax=Nannochloropsis gaditana TaxID=72520 RepID=W7TY60_9STRA|nr:hypothetical protein Naga_100377g5 [Nannochloropsis gaditana]
MLYRKSAMALLSLAMFAARGTAIEKNILRGLQAPGVTQGAGVPQQATLQQASGTQQAAGVQGVAPGGAPGGMGQAQQPGASQQYNGGQQANGGVANAGGAGAGGMGQNGMNRPGMQQPGMQQPGMQQPGMQQPGMQQPGMQQPGMQQPGMQQPGAQAGAGQATRPVPLVSALCNMTMLDQSLIALTTVPQCQAPMTTFSTTLEGENFSGLPLPDQVTALDTFCQTPCGPLFNKAITDWRTWCDLNRASFVPLSGGMGGMYSFDGFVSNFGCTKSAGPNGEYCAKLVMEQLMAKPEDTATRCAYYTSCCFGEMHRLVTLTDLKAHAAMLEAKCPGTTAALTTKCA